ncbi:MAG: hypothetical protein PHN32_07680 [Actinomycetota bacterium]|nr:hypothetical protein [Actinomycetota bacterium]
MIGNREQNLLKNAAYFYGKHAWKAQFILSRDRLLVNNISYDYCFQKLRETYGAQPADLSLEFYQAGKYFADSCLVLIHGYNSKNKKTYRQMAQGFAARGIDCLIYVLPLHFERKAAQDMLDQPQFINIFELYRQSVIELRHILGYLKEKGYLHTGCLGFSFGGYCCSLLACWEEQLDFAVPMASLGDLGPIKKYLDRSLELESRQVADSSGQKINKALAQNYLPVICPNSFSPLIDTGKILFIQGLLDGRTPVAEVCKFRSQWPGTKIAWYPCDHLTFILFNWLTVRIAARFIYGLK